MVLLSLTHNAQQFHTIKREAENTVASISRHIRFNQSGHIKENLIQYFQIYVKNINMISIVYL